MPMQVDEWRQLVNTLYELDAKRETLLTEAQPDKKQEFDQACEELMTLAGKLRESTGNYQPDASGNEGVLNEWKAIKSYADNLFKNLLKNRHQDWIDAINPQ